MFEHEKFENYTFENIPLDRDLYVVNEVYLREYENSMLSFFAGSEYKYVGVVSDVAARAINANSLELSWYANISVRFHEVSVTLPRDQFVFCVGSWQCDEKPRIFVKNCWLENIYLRTYSVFGLIDAAYVKKALENGKISRSLLIQLRDRIDSLAAKHIDVSFISFADSILLKSNWSVGYFESGVKYTYKPEIFIHLASEINAIYQEILGLNTYAVITQGSNEYYDDPLLHISGTKNHISLNSLGSPFAQLIEIEAAAKKAVKSNEHLRSELYMDEQYYRSLNYKHGFDKNANPCNSYQSKMIATPSKYYCSSIKSVLENLESQE